MSKQVIEVPKFSEAQRCFYPVRADCYYNGCEHNCIYCFSRATNSRFNQWAINNIQTVDIEKVETLFKKAFDGVSNSRVSRILRNKLPLRLGGITDLFQPCEKDRENTLKLIKLLNNYDYPYLIVTKSSLVSDDKYLKVLRNDLAYVQITITTLKNEFAKRIEPNASTVEQRLECLARLVNNGIYTAARISPLIPMYPDGYFSEKESYTKELASYFSFELVEELCNIKPNTIIIEFLRVSPMIKKILRENNMNDILALYNDRSINGKDGTLHFSLKEKETYCEKISKICKENDVDFTICEDNEYEYFKKYWANKNDCCNALNKIFNANRNTIEIEK